jgi:hypothetical protein
MNYINRFNKPTVDAMLDRMHLCGFYWAGNSTEIEQNPTKASLYKETRNT